MGSAKGIHSSTSTVPTRLGLTAPPAVPRLRVGLVWVPVERNPCAQRTAGIKTRRFSASPLALAAPGEVAMPKI
jgi:hypothetical protein